MGTQVQREKEKTVMVLTVERGLYIYFETGHGGDRVAVTFRFDRIHLNQDNGILTFKRRYFISNTLGIRAFSMILIDFRRRV